MTRVLPIHDEQHVPTPVRDKVKVLNILEHKHLFDYLRAQDHDSSEGIKALGDLAGAVDMTSDALDALLCTLHVMYEHEIFDTLGMKKRQQFIYKYSRPSDRHVRTLGGILPSPAACDARIRALIEVSNIFTRATQGRWMVYDSGRNFIGQEIENKEED